MIRGVLASALALAGISGCLGAAPAQQFRFEVASVKANKSGDRRGAFPQFFANGRFIAANLPLEMIIALAYDLPFQTFGAPRLSGGPEWLRSERFDIDARAEPGAIPAGMPSMEREQRMRMMLRNLLAGRFKLSVHTDTRQMPVYAIVVAKNGPKLEPSALDEQECNRRDAGVAQRAGQLRPEDMPCHQLGGGQGRGLHASAATISDVASFVVNWSDRPIVDRTGLKGLYRLDTEGWVPIRPPQLAPGVEPPTPEQQAMADPTRPTLFIIFERLGLKLESQKAPIETYTIEHLEGPTEN